MPNATPSHFTDGILPPPRQRINFGRARTVMPVPNLLQVQQESFEEFLQLDMLPKYRKELGIQEVFQSVFPISNFTDTASLEFVAYEIGTWECSCGKSKGIDARYTYACPCGLSNGVGDMVRDQSPRSCSQCGGNVEYRRCNRCDTRVGLKMKYTVDECRARGITYSAPIKATVRLVVWEREGEGQTKHIRDIKEQEVYLGEFPIMCDVYSDTDGRLRLGSQGTFIVNGTERVIVSQMHRSPGVFFKSEKGKGYASGRVSHTARIIPYRGSWLEFEFDKNDVLSVRIDRKRKLPATVLLRALGLKDDEDILRQFYSSDTLTRSGDVFLWRVSDNQNGERFQHDLVNPELGQVILPAGKKYTRATRRRLESCSVEFIELAVADLIDRVIAQDLVNMNTGEVLFEAGKALDKAAAKKLVESDFDQIELALVEGSRIGNVIVETLRRDSITTATDAQIEIYRRLRPGDPLNEETARSLFNRLFFDPRYYDLSKVGRFKLNRKLKTKVPPEDRTLRADDIYAVVRHLLELKAGYGSSDDIDHLGNRRIRSVGELLSNQLRIGLVRMERAIKERMSIQDLATSMPHDLINAKPVTSALKEFFGSSQLSQFMDQNNPLAGLTHRRRLSALGPGGLSRERAGFEVRDVHPTHYGRICPIETPEGPNVGLITSLSTFARVSEYGFIETPYRKVVDGAITDEIEYLTALDEDADPRRQDPDSCLIAPANAVVSADGRLEGDQISARAGGNFVMSSPKAIKYIDVSPTQLVSVSASLIPFLENDDANRALMGSNMQRQAVPLLRPTAPVVGTDMEGVTAKDSGSVVIARRPGIVERSTADRIIIRVDDSEVDPQDAADAGVDFYNLTKFQRSNQNTCISQQPIVQKGQRVNRGDVIADGPATDRGELALGRNVLVAFMPWCGYNFEDAILVNERIVQADYFTSVHIEEFTIEARDTKLGEEEITRDIINVGEENLKNLDASGIIRIGAKVGPGDILVGKITPKGETQLTPEEKLLRAIFGEKAGDVRDASLTVPPGIEGTVIGVNVFSRKGAEIDSRSMEIEEEARRRLERDFRAEVTVVRDDMLRRVRRKLVGKTLAEPITAGVGSSEIVLASGTVLDRKNVVLVPEEAFSFLSFADDDDELHEAIADLKRTAERRISIIKNEYDEKVEKVSRGDELPPGVIKMVKVYVAVKRKLSVGDKMAGRHGNKGVLAKIVPEHDMPYLPDGSPVDMVLNPLGVPSRMNVGQILETHLGWAAHELGIFVASPVFDGATEAQIKDLLSQANLPTSGQTTLYDGRTGHRLLTPTTTGIIYMMKLSHLVDDKIHARSIGPYSLVTQQPLGGKAQFGGQRFGEMEVWALEAYGAAYTLQEMITVKSDDVAGRTKIYQSIVKGDVQLEPGIPESFKVLIKELQSLALDVELIEQGEA
ncbi:MAG: DNA-directed RNA polymerase subunit beta [Candidatus Schekmanbacteria bacterium]|nr:DNA-directed RNA polymerase subunit beta [Candidatus Schekmanbacteria bacterium]